LRPTQIRDFGVKKIFLAVCTAVFMLFATTSVNAQHHWGRIWVEHKWTIGAEFNMMEIFDDRPPVEIRSEIFDGNLYLGLNWPAYDLTESALTLTFETYTMPWQDIYPGVSIEVISGESYKARFEALEKIVCSLQDDGNSYTAGVYDINGGVKYFDGNNISKFTFYPGNDFPSRVNIISIADFSVYALADELQIKAKVTIGQVAIINVAGTIVKSESISDNSATINISDLSTGVYFVRTSFGTKKFVKK